MADKAKLRHGYTTGATAAAAAKAAALWLLTGTLPETVKLFLPWGAENARAVEFKPVNPASDDAGVSVGVIKDGGDDPDATHGMEIRASASFLSRNVGPGIIVEGGEGIGVVTRPGLALPVGDAAINPVPLEMILESAATALERRRMTLRITISAPEGLERSKKTMNARLGIEGGISILGTTGIVIPMSTSAWTATIDACLDVAKASGATRALLAFGRTSERAGQAAYPELAGNAAVLMGDHVGYALDETAKRGLGVVIVGQFAKFVKLAAGNFETHVKDSSLDLGYLKDLMLRAGLPAEDAENALKANTAREVYVNLKAGGDGGLFKLLTDEVARMASGRISARSEVTAALFGYEGEPLCESRLPKKDGA